MLKIKELSGLGVGHNYLIILLTHIVYPTSILLCNVLKQYNFCINVCV